MSASAGRIGALTKDLWARWQHTRETWNDAKALEFERQYLQELNFNVDKTVAVIDQLDKLLSKIKKDCE